MQHIRPYQLFACVAKPPAQRVVQLQLPCRRAAGGLTMLETTLLIAATQIVNARSVFEFGTFMGSTTLNLALNVPSEGKVLTLDLDAGCAGEVSQHPADAPLTAIHLDSPAPDFVGSSVMDKITTLTGNSITFDFSAWQDSIDLVFIDGGHDLATVRSDTENALRLISKSRPSCIVWHDYHNSTYPDLSEYLDDLSAQMPLVHVEDTYFCVYFNDRSGVFQQP